MTCEKCGFQIGGAAKFCQECGSPLNQRCSSCGTELPASAEFCKECGVPTSFIEPADIVVDMKCPRCGNDNPENAQFCGLCGTSLGAYTAGDSTSQGMVSFPDAIRLGFQHYFDFRSRSTRAEYWWWALFAVLADVILSAVDMMIGTYNWQSGNGLISGLFGLGILIPGLALGARRLHDINRTGWWQLMWFGILLIVPMIILLWWAAKPSDEGTNKHGQAPRHSISQ